MPIREDLAARTIAFLRHGDFQQELSEAIAQCAKAADENGKKSTLKITFKFDAKNGQVLIEDDISPSPAKPNNPATIAFVDVHGNLTRNDPRQQGLELHEVPKGEDPVVDPLQEETGTHE